MLGSELADHLRKRGHKVFGIQRNSVQIQGALGNIDDYGTMMALRGLVISEGITHVVNCVAKTNTAEIERDPKARFDSFFVNARFPGMLGDVCRKLGLSLVHFSTDFVFSEYSYGHVCPITFYSDHKLMGELYAKSSGARLQVVRIGWIYGTNREKSFVHKFLRACSEARKRGRTEVPVITNQESTPTSCGFVCDSVERIMRSGLEGTFAISPSGTATRNEFAREILSNAETMCDWLGGIRVVEVSDPSVHPQNTVLAGTDGYVERLDIDWKEDLRVYMARHRIEFEDFLQHIAP